MSNEKARYHYLSNEFAPELCLNTTHDLAWYCQKAYSTDFNYGENKPQIQDIGCTECPLCGHPEMCQHARRTCTMISIPRSNLATLNRLLHDIKRQESLGTPWPP